MAVAAPTVQSLSDIVNEMSPSRQGQLDVINKRRENIAQQTQAQQKGLEYAKTNSFNQINNQMTGRGLSFSTIGADDMSRYLGEKYLPALAQLEASQNEQNLNLDNQVAQIQSDTFDKAYNARQQQIGALNTWNLQERNIENTNYQNDLDRNLKRELQSQQIAATARENALNRAATAASYRVASSGSGSSRSSSGGGGSSQNNVVSSVNSFLSSRTGRDGHVSPSDWQTAKVQWMQAGGSPSSFTSAFATYINRSHYQDYTGAR